MRQLRELGLAAAGLLLAQVSAAEVRLAAPDALVIEHRFAITATPAQAWEVLVHPERYWPGDHTWSGDPANLSLVPEAGGCFCERWTDASAEHGRVIMALPGRLLRFRGALGPFQEMAVTGVLTVALAARDGGTEAVVTYRLSGDPSHRLADVAAGVDPVIRQQFADFAALASRASGAP
ncbi:MAG: hypothetical protein MUF60_05900 [Vicinamibacterales bacterium]|jgi:uncharacterized protein YndB with AHSA1/START domain|nr:hypothetical protein [Vicinamibacterales bacterium]